MSIFKNNVLSSALANQAPYEGAITAVANAVKEWAGFLETLSPEIKQWIASKIPMQKQREIDRRMRKCKRICRKGGFNVGMITRQVNIDFEDLSADQKSDIVGILDFEINHK